LQTLVVASDKQITRRKSRLDALPDNLSHRHTILLREVFQRRVLSFAQVCKERSRLEGFIFKLRHKVIEEGLSQ